MWRGNQYNEDDPYRDRRDYEASLRRREYNYDRPNLGAARGDYGRLFYSEREHDERGAYRRGNERGERFGGSRREENYGRNRAWNDLRARDLMTRDVITVSPEDSVPHAARLMRDYNCGAIPVVDRNGLAIGMITDRDIAMRLVARGDDARRARVYDAMTHDVFACNEDDSIESCLREMARHQVRRLPVMDDRGFIIGIISQSDLARYAMENQGRGERREFAEAIGKVSEPSERPYR